MNLAHITTFWAERFQLSNIYFFIGKKEGHCQWNLRQQFEGKACGKEDSKKEKFEVSFILKRDGILTKRTALVLKR